ncbi:NADP-dependent oxidoreductase [Psychrobacter arenosus]|uniref:NADP-dependent oxidoreductase n=1 Tax=Psychrobacter arenosus TaxID=256326 RepID=UPI00191924BA|nr:NADP-dependent oxidoreductase [Psychrobacter arenosus]
MSLPTTQAAVTLTQFGEADVLNYQDNLPMPTIAEGEVLVKVAYAGINPVDYKTRQGLGWGAENIKNKQFANDEPAILGFDVAGTVAASNSADFKVGERVAALNFAGGCYAEYTVVAADVLAKVPEAVDLEVAGGLPCVGITAKQMLDFAAIQDGEHVVMSAPAGGVGHLTLQLLMHKVAENNVQVTVICSPEKYQKISELVDTSKLAGWIDYTKDEAFPNLDADILLDLVGGDAGKRALAVVKQGGRVVVLPSIWAEKLKEAGADKQLDVQGFIAKPNAEDLSAVLNDIAEDKLKLHIQKTYPLAQTQQAHEDLEQGDSFGKLILKA